MDTKAERDEGLRKLNGLIQIEVACRCPLPSHRVHAMNTTSFKALCTGLKPLHLVAHQLHMFALARQLSGQQAP